MLNMEEIRIGKKSKGDYISAILFAFQENHSEVVVSGVGTRVSKTYNVTNQVTQLLQDVKSTDSESLALLKTSNFSLEKQFFL